MGEDTPDLLERLNDAQRAAVTHTGAPLIVLAGPGTGKTRVITRRVAHAVRELGAQPESVVALTFTNKAAEEMRERIASLLDRSTAERLNVHTFHSYGRRLLGRFADIAGLPPEPMLIDSAQQRRLLRSIIQELGLYPEARASGIDSAVEHAAGVMETLRNHAISPGEALERTSRVIDDASTDEQARAEAVRLLGAVRAYEAFERACRERGWMSFADMVLAPIRLLRESELVREICRGEVRHVVVDEFQDVNRAQIELLRALTPPGAGAELCVVGDDDQAIYAFRGADERAFAHFRAIWPDAHTIALTESYRSERAIIDAAQRAISGCAERFAPDKVIERARSLRQTPALEGAGVEVVRLEDDGQNAEIAAALIRADMASRAGASLDDYAVIARTHLEVDRVRRALELEGVPVRTARPPSPSDDPGVQDVLAWARALCEPEAPWEARRVLLRPPFSFGPDAVNAWERAYRAQASRANAGDPAVAAPGAYIPWIIQRQGDDETRARLEKLGRWWSELGAVSASARADEALTRIVQTTGVAHADLLDARQRAARIAALVAMIRFARGRAPRLDQPADLRAFLAYLDDLSPRERGFESPDPGDALEPESAEASGGLGAVSVLTAHASKGLEFDTVILPRVTPPNGYPKNRNSNDEPLPEWALGEDTERPVSERHADEERRIFYVACTRARRRLALLAKLPKGKTKTTHYTLELLEQGLASERTAADVLRASRAGAPSDALERELDAYKTRMARRDVIDRARRDVRLDAAAALEMADNPEASPGQVQEAESRVAEAVRRMRVIASVERDGAPPPWAQGALGAYAESLAERAGSGEVSGSSDEARFPPMRAPLRLSYSSVTEYNACPRCYYLRRVLGLGEAPGGAMLVGQVVHEAMEKYVRARAEAENEGRAAPAIDRLLEIGRAMYFQRLPAGAGADRGELDQVLALLRTGGEMLDEPGVQVLEPERMFVFPYERDGVSHVIEAKLDRVDQLGGESGVTLRIVDYKTGRPRKALLEPRKDDLQLAIYAMALRSEFGDEAGVVGEYWLLRTGERGRLDLGVIDEAKVREKIDRAIDGMLSGDWSRKCRAGEGLCSILDAPG